MKTLRLVALCDNEWADPQPNTAEIAVTPELCDRVRELWAAVVDTDATAITVFWPSKWGDCAGILPDEWGHDPGDPLDTSQTEAFGICQLHVTQEWAQFDCLNNHSGERFYTEEVDIGLFTADLIGKL